MSSTHNQVANIYVELDVLLDSRLGTIAKIDNDLAAKVLKSGYHARQADVFDGVDKDTYADLYRRRDTETLARSAVTLAVQLLQHLVGGLAEQAILRPYHTGAKITVNTFPYQLTGEEKDQIGRALSVWMNGLAPVELTFIHPNNLTPQHCKAEYSGMLMYEYEEWMELHAKAFEQTILPEVTLFVPAIYFAKTPSVEELDQVIREATHPFLAIEMMASPLIDLKLIDVKYFSILSSHTETAYSPASPAAPSRVDGEAGVQSPAYFGN